MESIHRVNTSLDRKMRTDCYGPTSDEVEIVNSDQSTWLLVTKSKSTILVDFDETMIYHYWT